jgi:nucleoside-diphosphate-sugar epimerase
MFYVESMQYNFVTLQLSDTYGPHDTRPKIFNLWAKTVSEKGVLDMSPGEQLVDISHVSDVVNAFYRLLILLEQDKQKKMRGKVFAVSSGRPVSLRKLAKIFEKVSGNTLTINWGKRPYRPREVMKPWNKGKSVPGWKPTISIQKGIKETFHY